MKSVKLKKRQHKTKPHRSACFPTHRESRHPTHPAGQEPEAAEGPAGRHRAWIGARSVSETLHYNQPYVTSGKSLNITLWASPVKFF